MLPVRTSLVPSSKIMVSMVSAVIERDPEEGMVSAADCAPLARKQSSTARVARLVVADMIVALSEFGQTNLFEFLIYTAGTWFHYGCAICQNCRFSWEFNILSFFRRL